MGVSTHHIEVSRFDKIEDSPKYVYPEFQSAIMTEAVIVKAGMQSGKSTVDLIFQTEDGKKFVVLMPMSLIHNLSACDYK